ncbi:hypothetical protein Golob_014564 [Gossypium lobatum]|uniref:Putative plant transposon protein domain-containing protein n=1 Tax=Gossypium lobatum TaxID=34289 RepID=A0A7J8LYL5_9ROSI|nr:hypothetical protein [Gossypium lobatum]
MEGIIDYLTKGCDKWTRHPNTKVPLKFNTDIMFLMAKMWMQFICTHIAPTHNTSDVTTYQMVMLYSILQRDQICIGDWIYEEMLKCIRSRKQSMYFPHLITALCHRANILMSPIESFTRPMRSMIGDNLYGQFVDLQQKQNQEKEQRTKHRRIPQGPTKRKKKGANEEDEEEEEIPIVPSYYGQVLLPNRLSKKSILICDPSYHNLGQTLGRWATKASTRRGKGKAPMMEELEPNFE